MRARGGESEITFHLFTGKSHLCADWQVLEEKSALVLPPDSRQRLGF
jgi:hypothetical protein